MDWIALETFAAVCDELSFSKAARRLSVSHPTVTGRVQKLEREVGEQLLDRSTTHVSMTVAGAAVREKYALMREVWGAPDKDPTPDAREPGRRLLRFAMPGFHPASAEADRYYQTALPDYYVTWTGLSEDDAYAGLAVGDVDVFLGQDPPGRPVRVGPGIGVSTVVHEPVWLLAGPALLAPHRHDVPIEELRHLTWAISPPPDPFHAWEKRVLTDLGVSSLVQFTQSSGAMIRDDQVVGFADATVLPGLDGCGLIPLAPTHATHRYLAWNSRTVDDNLADRIRGLCRRRFLRARHLAEAAHAHRATSHAAQAQRSSTRPPPGRAQQSRTSPSSGGSSGSGS